jgi:hypothetical protein
VAVTAAPDALVSAKSVELLELDWTGPLKVTVIGKEEIGTAVELAAGLTPVMDDGDVVNDHENGAAIGSPSLSLAPRMVAV